MKYEKNRKIAGIDEYKIMKIAKIAVIPVIVIILVLVIVLSDSKKDKPVSNTKASTAPTAEAVEAGAPEHSVSENETNNEAEYISSFDDYGLQQNTVTEVNELVAKYQRAKVTGDAELMYKVFGRAQDDELESLDASLKEEAEAYESYDHTVCYTTVGCEEDSYLVFIASDLKFAGIDTAAPMLTWAYVYKADDGNFYMLEPDKLNDEQKALVDKVSVSEDVKMLDNDMRTRLAQAVINDAKLATLYQMWSDTDNADAETNDPNAIQIQDEETSEGETSEDESIEEADIHIEVEE